MSRTKVLYIAGAGRSASTLLGQVLGQVKESCFVGEIVYAWRQFDTRRCGCDMPLKSCDFWTAVHRTASGSGRPLGPELFSAGRRARWRYMPLTLPPNPRLATRFREGWQRCERLYPAIAVVSGARIVVDSSKSPVYGRMLAMLPALDVHVVHLVRDARAVAYSWRRIKLSRNIGGRPHMNRHPPARVARQWIVDNLATELFCRRAPDRYLRLRYEDFVERPREAFDRILAMLGEHVNETPFQGERAVALSPAHSVKGNPDRFRTGVVDLQLDDEWKHAMRPAERTLVTALTWPLLRRYGYA